MRNLPHNRLREGTFELADGRHAYFQDDETLRDAADLYSVLAEHHSTGSPNLENAQAREILDTLQSGSLLAEAELSRLLELLGKHADDIAELRNSADRDGQDLLHEPVGSRILEEMPWATETS